MTVQISNLKKKYITRLAVNIPELTIDNGECFGIVGNNGAGKTTLLRLILDLVASTDGKVLLDGRDVAKTVAWKQHTSSYLGSSYLIDFLTPVEYFQFVCSAYGITRKECSVSIGEFNEFLSNDALCDASKLIRDMSSGLVQRIGIISALIVKAKVLVLDEPFTNLDPAGQIQLRAILQYLNKERKTTIILSSHNLMHISEICSRIAVLKDGLIIRNIKTNRDTHSELMAYFTGEK